MTTPTSIDHFPDLKQPTEDYLSQVDGLTCELKKLKDETTNLLFDVETKALSSRNLLKSKNSIAFDDNEGLHKSYSKGLNLLSLLANDLKERKKNLNVHYRAYSNILMEKDTDNGNPTLTKYLKESAKSILFQSRILSWKLKDLRDVTQASIDNIQPLIGSVHSLLNKKIIPDKSIKELYRKIFIGVECIKIGYSYVADREDWVKDQYKYYSEDLAKVRLKKEITNG